MNNYEDKTDDRKETGRPAFSGDQEREKAEGGYYIKHDIGMTLQEYAAIHLRIPGSGIPWLDEMIANAERRDLSVKVFSAVYVPGMSWDCVWQNVDSAVANMLRARG